MDGGQAKRLRVSIEKAEAKIKATTASLPGIDNRLDHENGKPSLVLYAVEDDPRMRWRLEWWMREITSYVHR